MRTNAIYSFELYKYITRGRPEVQELGRVP